MRTKYTPKKWTLFTCFFYLIDEGNRVAAPRQGALTRQMQHVTAPKKFRYYSNCRLALASRTRRGGINLLDEGIHVAGSRGVNGKGVFAEGKFRGMEAEPRQ